VLKVFADWVTHQIFSITPHSLLDEAVDFFVYDTIKIFLLLIVIIFVISIIRSFLPPEKIRGILSHEKKYLENVLAAALGIFTPFCSCSAVPLFLGFVRAGVPLGVTFSFLVVSPMIGAGSSLRTVRVEDSVSLHRFGACYSHFVRDRDRKAQHGKAPERICF